MLSSVPIIGAFLPSLVSSLVLNQVSKLFLKRPSVQSFTQENQGRSITMRQSISPRRVIYGRGRYGGIITFIDTTTTGLENGDLHLVITVAGHEVDAITAMYFDGVLVPVDQYGQATGNFAGYAYVYYNLGTRDQLAFVNLRGSTPKWTVDHRQRGCACAYVRLVFSTSKFPNGMPNITFDVRGKKVYDPRTGTIRFTDNAALCIADYLNDRSLSQGLRYEPQSQRALFPDDLGFDFVPAIQEKNILWGPKPLP